MIPRLPVLSPACVSDRWVGQVILVIGDDLRTIDNVLLDTIPAQGAELGSSLTVAGMWRRWGRRGRWRRWGRGWRRWERRGRSGL